MEGIDMTEDQMQSVKMSTLYELRLIFTQGEKKAYTTDEIVELLDKIATSKDLLGLCDLTGMQTGSGSQCDLAGIQTHR